MNAEGQPCTTDFAHVVKRQDVQAAWDTLQGLRSKYDRLAEEEKPETARWHGIAKSYMAATGIQSLCVIIRGPQAFAKTFAGLTVVGFGLTTTAIRQVCRPGPPEGNHDPEEDRLRLSEAVKLVRDAEGIKCRAEGLGERAWPLGAEQEAKIRWKILMLPLHGVLSSSLVLACTSGMAISAVCMKNRDFLARFPRKMRSHVHGLGLRPGVIARPLFVVVFGGSILLECEPGQAEVEKDKYPQAHIDRGRASFLGLVQSQEELERQAREIPIEASRDNFSARSGRLAWHIGPQPDTSPTRYSLSIRIPCM